MNRALIGASLLSWYPESFNWREGTYLNDSAELLLMHLQLTS